MSNPYEPLTGTPAEEARLNPLPSFVSWTAWLMGWMFSVIGILGLVRTVNRYFFSSLPLDVALQIDAESFKMMVGGTIANLVLGPMVLWAGSRVDKRKWTQAVVGFVVAGVWATCIGPFLSNGFR